MKRLISCVLAAAVLAGGMTVGSASAQTLTDVKFTLDFLALGRHAPWYVAIAKGYYKEEGLNVTIIPSKGTADAIKAVEAGVSEFGFIDVPGLVAAGGSNTSIKIVAVNYQKTPQCVFSLNPGANVTSAKDMANLEFGSSSASFSPRIHMAFMKMHGVDPSTLRVVNIDGGARVPMLVAGKVQAVDLFIMSEPAIKRAAQGKEVKCLFLADHGLDIYSNSIGVKDEYLKKNPEIVRKFVRASLRGWRDALSAPEEAAKLQGQYVKGLQEDIVVEELKILKRLAVVPDTTRGGFGAMNKEKMKRTVDFINDNVDVQGRRMTVDDIYADGFLPATPVLPKD